MKNFLNDLLYKVFRVLFVQKKKVVFISHLGKSYSCNPKYLCEYLAKHHKGELDLVWIYTTEAPADLPDGVRAVKHFSRKSLYEICTTGCLVSNTRISNWFMFNKRKGQRYIQTWHSSLRLKCIEGDAVLPESYVKAAKKDSSQIDFIVSGCEFSSRIYLNSFWYQGPVLSTGTPRIDYLLNTSKQEIADIYAKAKLDSNSHYLLYAPTFRNGDDIKAYDIDYNRLKDNLEERFGGTWNILFRLHPNLQDKVKVDDFGDSCINMTQYPDMQELLIISEILITDYSSCMFDMAFIKKLCILYASDLEHYLANERNLYFDIKSLPFPLAQNNDELAEIIDKHSENNYQNSISDFMQRIGSFEDGKACMRISNYILRNK